LGVQCIGKRRSASYFLSEILFLLLTLTKAREHIITDIPDCLKHGTAAGIGLFIAFIGLRRADVRLHRAREMGRLQRSVSRVHNRRRHAAHLSHRDGTEPGPSVLYLRQSWFRTIPRNQSADLDALGTFPLPLHSSVANRSLFDAAFAEFGRAMQFENVPPNEVSDEAA